MQGTALSYQERECKLYNEFDKFTSIKGESLNEYYLRFAQIINDMHTIGMTMQQVQVNAKFLNALQPEWSKFVTKIKLAKNIYPDPLALVANHQTQSNSTQTKGNAINSGGNNAAGQARVVKCYNSQGEWHMARQCTQPKRLRNSAWFKEKMLLVQAQKAGQTNVLDDYDSDCDDISSTKAVLMASLSSYGSDILSEVTQHDTYQNDDMLNQSVQETQYFKQSLIDYVPDNEITSESNIISYK
ncbi:hypothetical protein Tco_0829522 [Tanacetum coccineum]